MWLYRTLSSKSTFTLSSWYLIKITKPSPHPPSSPCPIAPSFPYILCSQKILLTHIFIPRPQQFLRRIKCNCRHRRRQRMLTWWRERDASDLSENYINHQPGCFAKSFFLLYIMPWRNTTLADSLWSMMVGLLRPSLSPLDWDYGVFILIEKV